MMSLLMADSFSKLFLNWDGLAPATKTWPAWKTWALKVQKTTGREQCTSGHQSDFFGSAAAAITIHDIPSETPFAVVTSHGFVTPSMLDHHLDNTVATVTTSPPMPNSPSSLPTSSVG